MGCFWSSELDVRDRYYGSSPPPPYSERRSSAPPYITKIGPFFGEYRCSKCCRTWSSRLSWRSTYQVCRRCRQHVYPYNQRELRPSDRTAGRKGSTQDHPRELCQRCKLLGHYCGTFDKMH